MSSISDSSTPMALMGVSNTSWKPGTTLWDLNYGSYIGILVEFLWNSDGILGTKSLQIGDGLVTAIPVAQTA